MSQPAQFHSVYVQRRQSGVTRAQFQRLWRTHGDYAATVTAWWDAVERYVHNDPVEATAGAPPQTADYDGVGELFYTSFERWLSLRDVMWNEVAPDEKRVFAGPPTVSTRGERRIYQPPTGACKLFTFANPLSDTDPEAVSAAIDDLAARTLASSGYGARLAGLTVTRALRPSAQSGMDKVAQTASSHALLLIHHFASEADARAALASADHARLEVAAQAVIDWDTRVTILTDGWVLKGEMG